MLTGAFMVILSCFIESLSPFLSKVQLSEPHFFSFKNGIIGASDSFLAAIQGKDVPGTFSSVLGSYILFFGQITCF